MSSDMYILTLIRRVMHIGVGVIVYSWLKVLLEPEKRRISVDNIHALLYMHWFQTKNNQITNQNTKTFMKQKLLILLFAAFVGTSLTQASVVIDGIAYVINETKNVAAVTSGGTYTGEVVIPATITYNAKPYSVVSIGIEAFKNCSKLTSITIPNSVTTIGNSAFYSCNSLTAVHISDLAAWCKITFDVNPLSYAHNLYLNGTLVTDLVIPDGVTSIGSRAFRDCTSLTSVTIPNSVTRIENYAFRDCTGLTSVTIGNSVTSIGDCAFQTCSSLTSITIPNSVTSIGEWAFGGCSSLTSVTIPNSVTSIRERAFSGCSSLTSVTIPNSVTGIGESAFSGCSSLTSITIPNSVTSIGYKAFSECSKLTSVTIPNSVTTIGGGAFSYCTGLTSITIPNSVKTIEAYAFSGCTGLTSITIPNSVTTIGKEAFANCRNLIEIYDYRETPQSINSDVFSGVEKTICTLYVPYKAVSAYQNAEGWKEFKDIVPFGFNTFTITTAATNGTVTGGGLYAEGSTATLNATPNTGYRFTQWSDGNTDNPRTVTVTGDQKYTAMFVKVAFTVTVNQNCSITVK